MEIIRETRRYSHAVLASRDGRGAKLLASLVMLLALLLVTAAVTEEVSAATYSFRSSTIYADGTRTAKFTCNGMTGLCCEAGAYCTFSGSASLTRISNSKNAAICAYYYGYGKGWTTGSAGHKLARLLSYCMGHGTGGDFSTTYMKSLLDVAKKADIPEGFECWLCHPTGSSQQDFIVWRCPMGSLKVTKKSETKSISNNGTYTLAGMTIKIYSDADCRNCVKTLTTKKDGTTGGSFSLPAGTYYVKETSVPAVTGYILNKKVYKIRVPANGTGSVAVSNEPDTGSIRVRKVTIGEGGVVEGFRFILTGKKSGKKYKLVTGPDGTAKVSGLPFGKYTVKEDLTEEQEKRYSDRTGVQTVTIEKGKKTQDITVERKNVYEPQPQLRIVKKTGDDGPVSGFAFHVSWLLSDSRSITAEEIVAAADPQVNLAAGQSLGTWQVANPAVVQKINEDAKNGITGTYELMLKNTVIEEKSVATEGREEGSAAEPEKGGVTEQEKDGTAELEAGGTADTEAGGTQDAERPEADTNADGGAEDENKNEDGSGSENSDAENDSGSYSESTSLEKEISVGIMIDLREVGGTSLAKTGKSKTPASAVTAGEPLQEQSGEYLIECRNVTFAGAATTGEENVVTDDAGQYVFKSASPGIYTVTEKMTERQKQRYHQPETQRVTVTENNSETIVFSFMNEPILIPIKLQKESADGKLENVEFTLSGKPDYQDEPMEDIIVRTDEEGIADFGSLYPGSYVLRESEFDAGAYVNTYPMEGEDIPAFAFTITGDELSQEEVLGGACLWLGGDPGQGGARKERVSFHNLPYVDLWLTKVDGVTRSFLPGAQFLLKDSDGRLAARFQVEGDENGVPKIRMIESNEVITGESAQREEMETENGTAVVIGAGTVTTDEERGSDQPAYQCVVLHGLIEGEQYTLVEERAPEGFSPIEDPYVFTIMLDENGEPVLNTCDEYGTGIAAAARKGTLVIVNDAPSIGTVALDNVTGDHIADAAESVHLTDTCRVTNLAEGQTYTMVARLMDITEHEKGGNDSTVKQVMEDGKAVTGQITFTADAREHTVRVPLVLKGSSLAGRSTVVYESLYTGEVEASETETLTAAAEEANPDNMSQRIVFPEIGTTASMNAGGVIFDEVEYHNLLPGRTYCMRGTLMDKENERAIPGSITEKKFKADKSGSGTVRMKFRLDPAALKNQGIRDLVVFEKCYILGQTDESGTDTMKQVASHEDFDDMGQTVNLTAETPTMTYPSTGDRFKGIALLLCLLSMGLAGLLLSRKGRHSRIAMLIVAVGLGCGMLPGGAWAAEAEGSENAETADTITAEIYVGENGKVNGHEEDAVIEVMTGENLKLNIQADDGYIIDTVLINDEDLGKSDQEGIIGEPSAELLLEDLMDDLTVEVIFERASEEDEETSTDEETDADNETDADDEIDVGEETDAGEGTGADDTDAGVEPENTNQEDRDEGDENEEEIDDQSYEEDEGVNDEEIDDQTAEDIDDIGDDNQSDDSDSGTEDNTGDTQTTDLKSDDSTEDSNHNTESGEMTDGEAESSENNGSSIGDGVETPAIATDTEDENSTQDDAGTDENEGSDSANQEPIEENSSGEKGESQLSDEQDKTEKAVAQNETKNAAAENETKNAVVNDTVNESTEVQTGDRFPLILLLLFGASMTLPGIIGVRKLRGRIG